MRMFISPVISILLLSSIAIPANADETAALPLQVAAEAPQGVSGSNGPLAQPEQPVADMPTTTLYLGAWNNYLFQDFGFMAADCAVAQGGMTKTYGNDAFDLWGSHGCGGSANEGDFSWLHHGSYGPLDLDTKVAYYALSIGKNRMGDLHDDALYAHLNVGHTFRFGRFTSTPYARLEAVDGLNDLPFQSVLRVIPASIAFDVTDWANVQAEGGKVFCLTHNCNSPWEATLGVTINVDHFVPTYGVTLSIQDRVATNRLERNSIGVQVSWTFGSD